MSEGDGVLFPQSGLGGTPVCLPVQRVAMGPLQSLRCVKSLPFLIVHSFS